MSRISAPKRGPSLNQQVAELESLLEQREKEGAEEAERDELERQAAALKLRALEEEERNALADRPEEFARKELARRALCRKNLLPFVMRFNPDYHAGWVHKDIARRLEKFSEDVANKLSPRLLLTLPPRHGKLIAHDIPVMTENRGWVTHGDLCVGDTVYHPSGKGVKVVALSPESPCDQALTFSTGETIVCHENHEWVIRRSRGGKNKKWRTVETKWFTEKTHMGTQRQLWYGEQGRRGGRAAYQIPDTFPLVYSGVRQLPCEPYVLGVWLGDGTVGKPGITNSPEDAKVFQEAFAEAGYGLSRIDVHSTQGTHHSAFCNGKLSRDLKKAGVYRRKHIPEGYLRGSVCQRQELLAGLVDTDGHVDPRGRVRFVTTSEALRDGVFDLATTLALSPYVMMQPAALSSSGVQGRHDVYTVGFNLPEGSDLPTRLARKQVQRCKAHRYRSLTGIETVQPRLGRCIQVAASDGLYLVGRTLIPTHNSQLASKSLPAWHLGRYPTHEVMACSYSASLSMGFSRLNRELMRDPAYHVLFDTQLHPDSQGAEAWMTTDGGGYVAAGVGGAITGKGAHILLIDDPVKNREDAESETSRQNNWDWYTSTAYTRLAPGGGALVILTRWHDDDLAGRLIQAAKEGGDQWEIVNYPAEAKEDESYRRAGEALHPERYDLTALARIRKAVGPRDWAALYQQDPVPEEGAFFQKEDIQWYDFNDPSALPKEDSLVGYSAWDLAVGQKQEHDFSVGGVVSIDQDSNLWVRHIRRGHWGALDLCKQILQMHKQWRADRCGVESGLIEMSIGPFLEEMKDSMRLWDFNYTPLKPGRQDKLARARAIQGIIQAGKLYVPYNAPWTEAFVNELLRFPSGVNDDQVDMISWIGQMLMFMSPAVIRKERKPSWRDKLAKYSTGGGRKSAMTA